MEINKYVKIWLYTGLFMLLMQVVIGGITRLTGSGLSITKWEIVTGTIPPLNNNQWEKEFDLYKATPQYEKINRGISLKEFKFIYFWEYIHRLWARILGFVFLFPFIFFFIKKWIPRPLLKRLVILIVLAGITASFGWIMVASGLIERPWVNAYKLSIHLALGFSVFCYLLWIILEYSGINTLVDISPGIKRLGFYVTLLIILQIIFGGWVSGMKAALFYPSWPEMQGSFIPQVILNKSEWTVQNLIHYDESLFAPALIQFLHRTTAYLIILFSIYYIYKLFIIKNSTTFLKRSIWLFIILLITQVLLGIFTLINSIGSIPVALGVLHQGVGLLLLSSALMLNFQLRSPA